MNDLLIARNHCFDFNTFFIILINVGQEQKLSALGSGFVAQFFIFDFELSDLVNNLFRKLILILDQHTKHIFKDFLDFLEPYFVYKLFIIRIIRLLLEFSLSYNSITNA